MAQTEGRHEERSNAEGDLIMLITIKKRRRAFCDQLRIYSLNITILATVLLIFVFLGATSYLYMHSDTAIKTQKEQREYFEEKVTGSEWLRLNKKHGYPAVVIKGEEETPYFYDKDGHKCSFI
jgi:hypothetical protein